MGEKQKRQPPIFRRAVEGARPSAEEHNKLIAAVRQIMSQYAPYANEYGPEVFTITAFDSTRQLYTGTLQKSANPVHVTNALTGEASFEDTSPAVEKKEIVDPGGLLYEAAQIGNRVIAQFHPQSGYYLTLANLDPTVGSQVIRFRINSLAPYTDEISSPCEAVIAEVLSVSCQSSSVSVGDEVTIYDPNNCWFNVPIEVLEGASGQAVLMEAGVYEQVPDCVEASEEGCWWLVQHLCCTEELYAN